MTPASSRNSRTYICHVTVIDTYNGSEAKDQTVIISGEQIDRVAKSSLIKTEPGIRIVDGTGKFVIPGLWDMHVHGTRYDETLPLYIANGVTGVREMFGPPDAHLFRAELAAKHLLAPHIFLGSPIVDGNPPDRPHSIVVETPGEARKAVDEQKERGADFLKVYNELSRDAYFALVDEANRKNLPVEGHVPVRISAWEATAAKQKSIEHLLGIARACSDGNQGELLSKALAARDQREADLVVLKAWQTYSDKKCQHLFMEFKKNGSWPVPTLDAFRSFAFSNDPAFTNDPRVRYFGGEFGDWVNGKFEADDIKNWTPADFSMERELLRNNERVVGELYRAGVPILAGTDSGNSFGFPGFSLHDELAMMVDSGMPPFAALQSATWNPAVFMGAADKYGLVSSGRSADLILLDADPLKNIHNTTKISSVFFAGKQYDRRALDQILATAEATAKATSAK
jgi:Amidohydrolase family